MFAARLLEGVPVWRCLCDVVRGEVTVRESRWGSKEDNDGEERFLARPAIMLTL